MAERKYIIYYGTQNQDAGANPFHHAFLMFLKQETPFSPIEAIDSYGFYSSTQSSTTNPIIKAVKHLCHIKFDLQNSHGKIKQEKMHELNGKGIHGMGFAVNEEVFNKLHDKLKNDRLSEQQAIQECSKRLVEKRMPVNGHTLYIEEKALTEEINYKKRQELKRDLSPEETVTPRLKKFHISLKFKLFGIDSRASYTCKKWALDTLEEFGIVSPEDKKRFYHSIIVDAFPRFGSIPLQPTRFVSTGPLNEYQQKNGSVVYGRDWKKNNLFCASSIPFYKQSQHTLFSKKNYSSLNKILNRIQNMEIQLKKELNQLSAQATNKDAQKGLENLCTEMRNLYKDFSNVSQNESEFLLRRKLLQAQVCLNAAYLQLNPEMSNFRFRALNNVSLKHAVLGLLVCGLSTALFPFSSIWLLVTAASAAITGYKIFRFVKDELQFAEIKQHHRSYYGQSKEPDLSTDSSMIPATGLT